jgi:invasion protein IalB
MGVHRNIVFAFAAILAAFTLVPIAGFAQPAAAPANPAGDTHTSGSWTVRCYRAGTFSCDMTQASYVRGRDAPVAGIAIAFVAKSNAYVGRFVVPLGVAFDQGLGVQIGSYQASNLKYRRCGRDGCYVEGVLPTALIAAMQEGGDSGKGVMNIVLIDGRKARIPIVLDGFSDGLDLLKKWVTEKGGSAPKSGKDADKNDKE